MKSLVYLLCLIALLSCNKDQYGSGKDVNILVSTDSLYFDTVFTTVGSTTKILKIYNPGNKKVNLREIALAGENRSSFNININGIAAASRQNVEIAGDDSIYVFVNVNIDPSAENLPFIVQDSIKLSIGNETLYVQLSAWGQNARFLTNAVLEGHQEWNATLPYVITGNLIVKKNASLSIKKGTNVYFHGNASLVIDGALTVDGSVSEPVVFKSDRIDEGYNALPGSWAGINFSVDSKNNILNHAHILNAHNAVSIKGTETSTENNLILNACIIDNAFETGILANNASIKASNCLITNNKTNLAINNGGNYDFTHCTFAAYGNNYIPHNLSAIQINNSQTNSSSLIFPLQANFTNCIIWGENGIVEDEISTTRIGNAPFDVTISHSLYKLKKNNELITPVSSINNQPPAFMEINIDRRIYNFRLNFGSAAQDIGTVTGIIYDLEGNPRSSSNPDAGCYEIQ